LTPLLRLTTIVTVIGLAGCTSTYDGTINPESHSDFYVVLDDQSCVALVAHNRKPIHIPLKQFATPEVKKNPHWELMAVCKYPLPECERHTINGVAFSYFFDTHPTV